jgi:anthraniloyl-CoA monooxygenase
MKIICVGGGPASLYFSILMKQAFPQASIEIYERNRPDDTFGWGVVFSRETLGNLAARDPESYRQIEERFAYWDDIETYVGGQCISSTGHGFCGLARRELLLILQSRAKALGVELHFQRELKPNEMPKADLVLAADGVNSLLREHHADAFKPSLDWRKCKFIWLGTTRPLRAFTFVFKNTQWGLFQVHAYPFEKPGSKAEAVSTWIVEAREEVWRNAGLDKLDEAQSVAFLEKLFADDLGGHRLLPNKSVWRTFPTVRCEHWHHQNMVLLGDAVHTAHFSIGSGTKLAMEDAMALVDAFKAHGTTDMPKALQDYELTHKPEVIRLQRAAQTSLEWFENAARYIQQDPLQFTFNLMTRSKRITWDNLRQRDPALVSKVDEWFAQAHHGLRRTDGSAAPAALAPFKLRALELPNRIAVSPMCQYMAKDGLPDDWHMVHLGSRAMGGAGLVLTEMTDVSAQARISYGCTGLYNDAHTAAWKRIVEFVHQHSRAKIGVQLSHAGRKGSCQLPWEGDGPLSATEGAWQTWGPSALPYAPHWHTPKEMGLPEMKLVKEQFVAATHRAIDAGFDLIELHCAHGYLLSEFLSPLSNRRTDEFGGSLVNRLRYPLEIFDAMRAVWPQAQPMAVRISASDWLGPDGLTVEDAVEIGKAFKAHDCDIIDVSSGGNVPESKPEFGRMFQVPFAEAVKYQAEVPVMAVGGIMSADHANTIVAAGRADMCALARAHLSDPYLTARFAKEEGVDTVAWSKPYHAVRPVPKPAAPKR